MGDTRVEGVRDLSKDEQERHPKHRFGRETKANLPEGAHRIK